LASAPANTAPVEPAAVVPQLPQSKPVPPKSGAAAKTQITATRPKSLQPPQQQHDDAPRPPRPISQSSGRGLFGLFR
jgi:hypothetical protein